MMSRTLFFWVILIGWFVLPADCFSAADQEFKEKKIELVPVKGGDRFFIDPDRSAVFMFKVKTLPEQSLISYEIHDYPGRLFGPKGVSSVQNGLIKLERSFPPGYYEICFPDLDQIFGICSLSAYDGVRDSFYAIEGLLGNRRITHREAMTDVLVRYGIFANREWCVLNNIEPEPGRYQEQTDQFYHYSGSKGMKSIFCINDFPKRFDPRTIDGRGRVYPADLTGLSDSLRNIILRRSDGIDAFHLFNEYDLKKIPSSVWLPGIKAAGWAMKDLPFLLASAPYALGSGSEFSLNESLENGLLDVIDVFTFHSYQAPEKMIDHIAFFRDKMKNRSKAGLPFWITESGKPWNRGLPAQFLKQTYGGPLGNLHPVQKEDALSALWITMKGIEAKAGGVQRYFPFTLPFFQENNNNFGMTDYYGTPLRSLTAYCRSVRELGGKRYAGDLNLKLNDAVRFRFFTDGKKRTAVLYTGTLETKTVDLGELPVLACRSIDGSVIKPVRNKVYPIENGLAYFDLAPNVSLDPFLQTETEAMKLLREADQYRPVKRICSPVVYSYKISEKTRYDTCRFYWDSDLFTVRAYNFSNEKLTIDPKLLLPAQAKIVKSPDKDLLTLNPKSKADLQWSVDLSDIVDGSFRVGLSDSNFPISGFSLLFLDQRKLICRSFDFMNPARWKSNTSGRSLFEYDEKEKALKVTTEFKPDSNGFEHWVFPEYALDSKTEKLDFALGLSFEMKIIQDGGKTNQQRSPCVMLVPGDRKKNYIALSCSPSASDWTACSVSFDQKNSEPFRAIRIGTCPAGYKVIFWLKNIKIQYTK